LLHCICTLGVKIVKVKSVSKFGNDAMFLSIVEETKFNPFTVADYASAPPTAFSKRDVEEKELEEDIIIVLRFRSCNN
jgi:hypothetical protein